MLQRIPIDTFLVRRVWPEIEVPGKTILAIF